MTVVEHLGDWQARPLSAPPVTSLLSRVGFHGECAGSHKANRFIAHNRRRVGDVRLLKFIGIADGGTSERLMATSHPTFHRIAPLKSNWA